LYNHGGHGGAESTEKFLLFYLTTEGTERHGEIFMYNLTTEGAESTEKFLLFYLTTEGTEGHRGIFIIMFNHRGHREAQRSFYYII